MSNTLQSVHPELVSEWSDKNLPLTPDKITFGSNKRVWWKGSCGHEWQASVKARSGGEKCPICSGARVVEGINDLATLKPQLAQEWSKKNELKPTEVSVASHKKVIWKCKNGHEWTASIKSRTVNGTGCPYCSHNKVLAGFNDLASQYPEVAAEWSDRNLPLQPTMVTAFANSKAWWKCSLGMMTINALVSSDSVLIPVQAAYLPVKGLQQLIKTISMVKKRLNRRLTIEGILLTMVDFRTNYAKDIAALVQETYGSQIAIFKNVIPMSVKAAETSAEGISIYTHCPKGKVSMAYMNLTQEVMSDEK